MTEVPSRESVPEILPETLLEAVSVIVSSNEINASTVLNLNGNIDEVMLTVHESILDNLAGSNISTTFEINLTRVKEMRKIEKMRSRINNESNIFRDSLIRSADQNIFNILQPAITDLQNELTPFNCKKRGGVNEQLQPFLPISEPITSAYKKRKYCISDSDDSLEKLF